MTEQELVWKAIDTLVRELHNRADVSQRFRDEWKAVVDELRQVRSDVEVTQRPEEEPDA